MDSGFLYTRFDWRFGQMKFSLYKTAQAYLDAAGSVLQKYEIQNNLFFRNIKMGLASQDNSNRVMATVADDQGNILISATRTVPHAISVPTI
jgi:hypothetical protein